MNIFKSKNKINIEKVMKSIIITKKVYIRSHLIVLESRSQ